MSYRDEDYGEDRKRRILKCYAEIIRQNPADLEARRGRLELYIEQARHDRAVLECEAMLQLNPYDLVALQCLAASSIHENLGSIAQIAYQRAIAHFQAEGLTQRISNTEEEEGGEEQFSMADLNDYIELFLRLEQHEDGIRELKSVARWLVGRANETHWDDWTLDDREWDELDQPRRTAVPDFQPGAYPLTAYGNGLPMELRAKLGIFRLRLDHMDEAMAHFERFAPESRGVGSPVLHYPGLFRDIGNALFNLSHYEDALRFYKAIDEQQPLFRQPGIHRNIAIAYMECNNDDMAIQYYKRVVERLPGSFVDGIELTKLYEKQGRAEEGLGRVREMLQRGGHKEVKASGVQCGKLLEQIKPPPRRAYHRRSRLPPVDASWGEGGPVGDILEIVERAPTALVNKPRFRSLAPAQLRRLHERLEELHKLVREEEDEAATDEYLKICEVLVDQWAQIQVVYTGSELKPFATSAVTPRRLGSASYIKEARTLPDDDHYEAMIGADEAAESSEILIEHAGIPFEQWLDVHCEYALLLAKREYREEAFAVLGLTEESKIFGQDDLCVQRIHICALACAMACNDEEKATVGLRWFVKNYGHASDVWRVYNLFSLVYPKAPNWYNAGPAQKYWMRTVKGHDYALMSDKQRKEFNFSVQEKLGYWKPPLNLNAVPGARHGNPQGLPSPDPSLLVFYGHLLTHNGSYANALNYFLRAYAIAPTAPLTLFSIATAYIQVAMKRVAENRHYSILLGLAFFGEYKRRRLGSVRKGGRVWRQRRMEVAYNEARAWHFLGLAHLAMPKYERCLAIAGGEAVPDQVDDEGPCDQHNGNTDKNGQHEDVDVTDAHADAHAEPTHGTNSTNEPEPELEDESNPRDEPDYAHEAAFALQHMMVLAGNTKEARRIGERWLVF